MLGLPPVLPQPLTAAGGNSSAARSARARLQWRDRHGRWIEMGRGIKFKVRFDDGSIRSVIGKFVGSTDTPEMGQVYVRKDPSGLLDGFYNVKSANAAENAAQLTPDQLVKAGIELGKNADGSPAAERLDRDIQNVADIPYFKSPIGWLAPVGGRYETDDKEFSVMPASYQVNKKTGANYTLFRNGKSVGNFKDWPEILTKVNELDAGAPEAPPAEKQMADLKRENADREGAKKADEDGYDPEVTDAEERAKAAIKEYDSTGEVADMIDNGSTPDEIRSKLAEISQQWVDDQNNYDSRQGVELPTPQQKMDWARFAKRKDALDNLEVDAPDEENPIAELPPAPHIDRELAPEPELPDDPAELQKMLDRLDKRAARANDGPVLDKIEADIAKVNEKIAKLQNPEAAPVAEIPADKAPEVPAPTTEVPEANVPEPAPVSAPKEVATPEANVPDADNVAEKLAPAPAGPLEVVSVGKSNGRAAKAEIALLEDYRASNDLSDDEDTRVDQMITALSDEFKRDTFVTRDANGIPNGVLLTRNEKGRRPGDKLLAIDSLYTRKRGDGAGTALMQNAAIAARDQNRSLIVIGAVHSAKPFYAKMGANVLPAVGDGDPDSMENLTKYGTGVWTRKNRDALADGAPIDARAEHRWMEQAPAAAAEIPTPETPVARPTSEPAPEAPTTPDLFSPGDWVTWTGVGGENRVAKVVGPSKNKDKKPGDTRIELRVPKRGEPNIVVANQDSLKAHETPIADIKEMNDAPAGTSFTIGGGVEDSFKTKTAVKNADGSYSLSNGNTYANAGAFSGAIFRGTIWRTPAGEQKSEQPIAELPPAVDFPDDDIPGMGTNVARQVETPGAEKPDGIDVARHAADRFIRRDQMTPVERAEDMLGVSQRNLDAAKARQESGENAFNRINGPQGAEDRAARRASDVLFAENQLEAARKRVEEARKQEELLHDKALGRAASEPHEVEGEPVDQAAFEEIGGTPEAAPHAPDDEALPATPGDAPSFGYVDSPEDYADLKFMPTDEQRNIIMAVLGEKNVAVEALAGTGKTSTLELIANRMRKVFPKKRVLYIAFNKSVQTEAEGRMPDNVESRTGDSLGWMGISKGLTRKKNNKDAIGRPRDVANHFGINDIGELRSDDVARELLKVISKYAISDADNIGPEHFEDLDIEPTPANLAMANKMWGDITSPQGKLRFGNDHATKIWALSKPDLSKLGSGVRHPADVIFFDEAQDVNPVMAKVVRDQKIQRVLVGDENQAIYGFRGAVDELGKAEVDLRLPLTQSWRFGPEVAGVGNRFLSLLKSKFKVVGGGKKGEIVPEFTMEDADAVLTRTNSGAIKAIIEEMDRGRVVGVSSKYKDELSSLVNTAAYLKDGGPKPFKLHDDLTGYKSWKEIEDEVNDEKATKKVEMLYRLIEKYGTGGLSDVIGNLVIQGPEGDKAKLDLKPGSNGPLTEGVQYDIVEDANGIRANLTGNTFQIKDRIKQAGFRFQPADKAKGEKAIWYRAGSENQVKAALEQVQGIEGKVDVIVTTAHKAKGLEWNNVRIGADFWGPQSYIDENGESKLKFPSPEEMRLAYVAVTRAAQKLDPGSLAWVYQHTEDEDEDPTVPSKGLPDAEASFPETDDEDWDPDEDGEKALMRKLENNFEDEPGPFDLPPLDAPLGLPEIDFEEPFDPTRLQQDPAELAKEYTPKELEEELVKGVKGEETPVDPQAAYVAINDEGGDARHVVAEIYDAENPNADNVDKLEEFREDHPAEDPTNDEPAPELAEIPEPAPVEIPDWVDKPQEEAPVEPEPEPASEAPAPEIPIEEPVAPASEPVPEAPDDDLPNNIDELRRMATRLEGRAAKEGMRPGAIAVIDKMLDDVYAKIDRLAAPEPEPEAPAAPTPTPEAAPGLHIPDAPNLDNEEALEALREKLRDVPVPAENPMPEEMPAPLEAVEDPEGVLQDLRNMIDVAERNLDFVKKNNFNDDVIKAAEDDLEGDKARFVFHGGVLPDNVPEPAPEAPKAPENKKPDVVAHEPMNPLARAIFEAKLAGADIPAERKRQMLERLDDASPDQRFKWAVEVAKAPGNQNVGTAPRPNRAALTPAPDPDLIEQGKKPGDLIDPNLILADVKKNHPFFSLLPNGDIVIATKLNGDNKYELIVRRTKQERFVPYIRVTNQKTGESRVAKMKSDTHSYKALRTGIDRGKALLIAPNLDRKFNRLRNIQRIPDGANGDIGAINDPVQTFLDGTDLPRTSNEAMNLLTLQVVDMVRQGADKAALAQLELHPEAPQDFVDQVLASIARVQAKEANLKLVGEDGADLPSHVSYDGKTVLKVGDWVDWTDWRKDSPTYGRVFRGQVKQLRMKTNDGKYVYSDSTYVVFPEYNLMKRAENPKWQKSKQRAVISSNLALVAGKLAPPTPAFFAKKEELQKQHNLVDPEKFGVPANPAPKSRKRVAPKRPANATAKPVKVNEQRADDGRVLVAVPGLRFPVEVPDGRIGMMNQAGIRDAIDVAASDLKVSDIIAIIKPEGGFRYAQVVKVKPNPDGATEVTYYLPNLVWGAPGEIHTKTFPQFGMLSVRRAEPQAAAEHDEAPKDPDEFDAGGFEVGDPIYVADIPGGGGTVVGIHLRFDEVDGYDIVADGNDAQYYRPVEKILPKPVEDPNLKKINEFQLRTLMLAKNNLDIPDDILRAVDAILDNPENTTVDGFNRVLASLAKYRRKENIPLHHNRRGLVRDFVRALAEAVRNPDGQMNQTAIARAQELLARVRGVEPEPREWEDPYNGHEVAKIKLDDIQISGKKAPFRNILYVQGVKKLQVGDLVPFGIGLQRRYAQVLKLPDDNNGGVKVRVVRPPNQGDDYDGFDGVVKTEFWNDNDEFANVKRPTPNVNEFFIAQGGISYFGDGRVPTPEEPKKIIAPDAPLNIERTAMPGLRGMADRLGFAEEYDKLADQMLAWWDEGYERTKRIAEGAINKGAEYIKTSRGIDLFTKAVGTQKEVDNEVLASRVARALGIEDVIVTAVPGELRVVSSKVSGGRASDNLHAATDIERHQENYPNARRIGLLDYLIQNGDRHRGNWFIDANGQPVPIDHGNIYFDVVGSGWFDQSFAGPALGSLLSGESGDPLYTKAELIGVRQRLEALKEDFIELDRGQWHQNVIGRMQDLLDRAENKGME